MTASNLLLLFSHSVVSDSLPTHGLQPARLLCLWTERLWLAISFSRGSSRPGDWTWVSCIGRRILYHWTTRESESEVAQSCPTLCGPRGLQPTRLLSPWDFPAKVLEWGAICSQPQLPLSCTCILVYVFLTCTVSPSLPSRRTPFLQAGLYMMTLSVELSGLYQADLQIDISAPPTVLLLQAPSTASPPSPSHCPSPLSPSHCPSPLSPSHCPSAPHAPPTALQAELHWREGLAVSVQLQELFGPS